MKKLLTLTAACLLGTGCFAQSISNMRVVNHALKQVEFTVSWTEEPDDKQFWVIADYIKISGVSQVGSWTRAGITGATITENTNAGTVTVDAGEQGFWLSTSGNSGVAKITVQLGFSETVNQFNWCAIALSPPPKAALQMDGSYMLYGQPPFVINETTLATDVTTFGPGDCITSFTDATGNPAAVFPTAPTGLALTSTATTVCAGTPATLTAAAVGATSYSLDGITWQAETEFVVTPSASTVYTLWATIAGSCTATLANAATVTVNDLPAVSTVTASTLCAGNTAALTATLSSGATSAMTYTWTIGNTAATTTEVNTYTTDILTADTPFTVTVTNANGCTGAEYAGTITVNALPVTPTGASANAVCGEGNIAFSVNEPESGSTIDWYTAATGGNTLTKNSATHTAYLSPGMYTYYAEARNETTQCVSAARLAVAGQVADPAVLGCPGGTCTVCGCVPGALAAGGRCFDWMTMPYKTTISIGTHDSPNYSAAIALAVALGLDANGATVRREYASQQNRPVYCCSDSACSQTYVCTSGNGTHNGWTYVLP